MPEQIRCPECDATLRVPDSLLGKTVKCPKCQTTFTAELGEPEEREEIVRELPPAAAARHRPRLSEEGEEGSPPEEEDDERPRRRRRRSSAAAESAVLGPAISLMVTGGFGIIAAIAYLIFQIVNLRQAGKAFSSGQAPPGYELGLTLGKVFVFIIIPLGIIWGIVLLVGGLRMKNLQSFGLAMTSCILAILPFNCCCLLGLPIGIWGLVALNNPAVKKAFARNR
jgi:predicted Zn finger-like uncharacterized protein